MPLLFDHSPNPSFTEAFCRHRVHIADKWEDYLAVYDEILQRMRSECANFLEIGVNNGGSAKFLLNTFAESKLLRVSI